MNDETGGDAPTLAQLRSWLGPEVAIGVLDVPTDGRDPSVLGVRRGARQRAARGRAQEGQGHEGPGQERRLRSLRRQRRARRSRSPRDTALISNTRAVVEAAIARLGGERRRPGRRVRLPGHDVEARDRQHRRRLRARLDAPEADRRRAQERSHRALAGRLAAQLDKLDRPARRRAQRRLLASARPTRACAYAGRRSSTATRRASRRRTCRACSTACPPARGSWRRSATSARTPRPASTRRSARIRARSEQVKQVQADARRHARRHLRADRRRARALRRARRTGLRGADPAPRRHGPGRDARCAR